jgi:hypothetical protein
MSLAVATLIPGLLLFALGAFLLIGGPSAGPLLKAFPRSTVATVILFGGAACWFLSNVLDLTAADFGDYRKPLFAVFALVAVLAFKFAPDFLAVRGLAALTLLGSWPLLMAAYMQYDQPSRLFMVTLVYAAVTVALWLGAAPFRLRDFLQWLFARPGRIRATGGLAAGYGLLLVVVAFTYKA